MDNELVVLLHKFSRLLFKKFPDTTFLEIVDKTHLENVWSRILVFYFDPQKKHDFHVMLIKSLFDSLEKDVALLNVDSYRVRTEYPTKKGNRIDIVVESDDFVIGIENKVNATLYNDLDDYSDALDTLARGRKTYKVVLSKYKNQVYAGFENITYEKFIAAIKVNLGYQYKYANTKYLIFFLDFIDNIEKNLNLNNMIYDKDVMNFFLTERETIQNLIDKDKTINSEFNKGLNEVSLKLQGTKSLQIRFKQLFPHENLSFSVNNVKPCEGINYLWIVIKFDNPMSEIIVVNVYYEDYKWHADCCPKNKLITLLTEDIKDPKFGFNLEPWTPIEEICSKTIGVVENVFDLLKQHEKEMFEIPS